jgi:hypothetical protein
LRRSEVPVLEALERLVGLQAPLNRPVRPGKGELGRQTRESVALARLEAEQQAAMAP